MLCRCYSNPAPTYLDVEVDSSWHDFQIFAEWFELNNVEGWDLDKDLLGNGKLYSENFCCFLPREINIALIEERNDKVLSGFSKHRLCDKYQISCRLQGKKKYLGLFENIEDAKQAYDSCKKDNIKILLEKYSNYLTDTVKWKIIERFKIENICRITCS